MSVSHETPPAAPAKRGKGRLILLAILLASLAVVGRMVWHSYFFEETDNAYLAAHVSPVAPRIAGAVTRVAVQDNQWVKAGDVLFELDTADQAVKVAEISARIAQLEQEMRRVDATSHEQQAEAAAAKALVARAQADLTHHQQELRRLQALRQQDPKAVAAAELDAGQAAQTGSQAEFAAQNHRASAAQARLVTLGADRAVLAAQKKVLAAQLEEAKLQQQYTRIVAPVSGRVGKKTVEVGMRLQAGQAVLAVVQPGVWVTANFKETQLGGIYVGQTVNVTVDALAGEVLQGKVDSFSPASGAQFSLLPPDNATGNFTKIVQRVPVKIVLDAASSAAMQERLVPGMSAVVEIDVRQGKPVAANPS